MRKFLFYVWCLGGTWLFYQAIKFAVNAMSGDMALGFFIGVMFMVTLFAINERMGIKRGLRDPQTGDRIYR